MRRLIGSIIKAQQLFNLFEKNDRILIGVSGGKDSSLLLYALNLYVNKINKKKWNIKIFAAHVNLHFYQTNYQPYLNWLNENKLNVQFIDSNVSEVLELKKKNNKIACSLCSKMKKAILIKEAKKLNCNKVAMAHHFDDAIETLFLNLLNEGRIATFKPKSHLSREKIILIRPFVLTNESTIIQLQKKLNIPVIKNQCPNEKMTQRTYLKEFIQKNFYENKLFPNAYLNLRNSLINGKNSELWFVNDKSKIDLLKKYKLGKLNKN